MDILNAFPLPYTGRQLQILLFAGAGSTFHILTYVLTMETPGYGTTN